MPLIHQEGVIEDGTLVCGQTLVKPILVSHSLQNLLCTTALSFVLTRAGEVCGCFRRENPSPAFSSGFDWVDEEASCRWLPLPCRLYKLATLGTQTDPTRRPPLQVRAATDWPLLEQQLLLQSVPPSLLLWTCVFGFISYIYLHFA